MQIDTGDIVLHRPTGEEWTVAYVLGDKLAWCGWPEGEAELADCELVTSASDLERIYLLENMAKLSDSDSRGRYARDRMAQPIWKQRRADPVPRVRTEVGEHEDEHETEGIVHRVCEALSGTCVMVHEYPAKSPHHPACNIENCSAYRAAFSATPTRLKALPVARAPKRRR